MNQIFLQSLEIMWKGMLSIFIVIGLIMLVVVLITKLTKK